MRKNSWLMYRKPMKMNILLEKMMRRPISRAQEKILKRSKK
jgi:hypothetical protein